MSVSTTDNPTATQVHHALNDYQIRLTGENAAPIAAPNRTEESDSNNPDNWPQHYRRVPSYRPINRNMDHSERESPDNPVERAFIFVMLRGVWLNATVSQTWRKTGGRINNTFFRYAIGGEW